jgi:hypothetical protein
VCSPPDAPAVDDAPELVDDEVELVGVVLELADDPPPPIVPTACTDSPRCFVNTDVSAPGGGTSLYVVPILSVTVKSGAAPPRQPSTMSPPAAELGALA